MDIRWMRSFLAVAEELNFGRAAQRLHLAQPAVTAQILNLEKDLSVRLFERNNRGVRLTDAGEAFLQPCRDALRSIETAGLQARNAGTGEYGKIRIGFNAACGIDQLIPLSRAIRVSYPHLDLRIDIPRRGSEIVQLIESDELDIGLLDGPVSGQGLSEYLLSTARLCAVVPDDHRLAGLPEVSASDLQGEPFVMLAPNSGRTIRSMVEQVCDQVGFRPAEVIEVRDVTAVLAMVIAGAGFGFTTTASRLLTPAGLSMLPLIESMDIPAIMVWKTGSQTRAMLNVLQSAREVFGLRDRPPG